MTGIKFVANAPQDAALWGSSTFGGPITYGQAATDAAVALTYRAIPIPQGYLDPRVWSYRRFDTEPDIELAIVSSLDDFDPAVGVGVIKRDGTIDPDPIAVAEMVLDRVVGSPHRIVLPLVVGETFKCQLQEGQLDRPGEYRVVVRLVMNSGRVLTVPTYDQLTFTIAARMA